MRCMAFNRNGASINSGRQLPTIIIVQLPAAVRQSDLLIQGEVLFTDRFGNAITNITKTDMDDLRRVQAGDIKISLKGNDIRLSEYYSQAAGQGNVCFGQ